MERTAAVKRAHVINDALVVIYERCIQRLIAGALAQGPAIDVRLGQPKTIGSKVARPGAIAEKDDSFALWRVRGKARNLAGGIQRLDVKTDGDPGELSG